MESLLLSHVTKPKLKSLGLSQGWNFKPICLKFPDQYRGEASHMTKALPSSAPQKKMTSRKIILLFFS